MLSLPDFREKQILFVNGSDVKKDKLKFANENIRLEREEKIKDQVSCHKIFALFVIGDCSLTTVLIRNCQKYGVSVFLLKYNFETYARIISSAEGNYLLRMKQYRMKNELEIAKKLVSNKMRNQIFLLEKNEKKSAVDYLTGLMDKITLAKNGKNLLGLEGSASKFFFQNYFLDMGWKKRMPRTKIDIANTLLDLGYTLLFNFIDGMLGAYGFDAYKGFYHKLFFQRKSLTCDLAEPFRAIIDKQLLKSYHLSQINQKDFRFINGRYGISYDNQNKYLEIFSQTIMEKKERIFSYVRDFYYFIMNDSEFPVFQME